MEAVALRGPSRRWSWPWIWCCCVGHDWGGWKRSPHANLYYRLCRRCDAMRLKD